MGGQARSTPGVSSLEDVNIKNSTNKIYFNMNLLIHYLDKLSSTFKCPRLLCLYCHISS